MTELSPTGLPEPDALCVRALDERLPAPEGRVDPGRRVALRARVQPAVLVDVDAAGARCAVGEVVDVVGAAADLPAVVVQHGVPTERPEPGRHRLDLVADGETVILMTPPVYPYWNT